LKEAVVRPRLKKPTLDPDDVNSNLSFLSKVVERVAAARLNVHIDIESVSMQLLPSRQSANHSTETAIISVHDDIVRTIDAGDVCAVVYCWISVPNVRT